MTLELLFNELVKALVPVVVAFLAGLSALALNAGRRWLEARFGREEADLISGYVTRGVLAARYFLASASGQERKSYALRYIQSALQRRGIRVDLELLSQWVEAELANLAALDGPAGLNPSAGQPAA